jgi:hypothetical protein
MDDYQYVPDPAPAAAVARFIVEQTGDAWVAYSPALRNVVEPQWGRTGEEALQNFLMTLYQLAGKRSNSSITG